LRKKKLAHFEKIKNFFSRTDKDLQIQHKEFLTKNRQKGASFSVNIATSLGLLTEKTQRHEEVFSI